MRIGPVTLSSNLFLSPLAGYTNLPMRLTVRELGGLGWATTDLVNARSLIERSKGAMKLVETAPGDQPLAIQLFGSVPEEMRDAAVICKELGAQSVDVNMGCPVKKVVGIGGGAAMMTELNKTAALVRGMVEAVGNKIPVTAKMRLGWDDANITAPDLARVLADVGVAAIFVHGRTRAQGFSGTVNLAGIRAVVEAVPGLPVIGNGDVTTPESARHMIAETGCAGVSVGRGAFYDPWIFKRTEHLLRTGELLPEPTFAERLRVMTQHFERYCEFYGEEHGARLFRRVAPWYARRFGPSKLFKQKIITITSRADFAAVVAEYVAWRAQFCDTSSGGGEGGGGNGELLPRFRLEPLTATFMRAPGEAGGAGEGGGAVERAAIPVPKGPVDRW
ncbi:tRNA dihydrouridine synthase DusB [Opitutaceae bacterium TAV4]|nr:tRNA dihydrouridine synthase DusB [Opitutaceae bacterium TAV4]RRK02652.1 tRNA dihydrouridine synthase DusB [Opitutaceae bacterium TAV3]